MTEPFLARLPKGEDLLDALTQAFRDRLITKASFSLIGAVSRAVLGYYDPVSRGTRIRSSKVPLRLCHASEMCLKEKAKSLSTPMPSSARRISIVSVAILCRVRQSSLRNSMEFLYLGRFP